MLFRCFIFLSMLIASFSVQARVHDDATSACVGNAVYEALYISERRIEEYKSDGTVVLDSNLSSSNKFTSSVVLDSSKRIAVSNRAMVADEGVDIATLDLNKMEASYFYRNQPVKFAVEKKKSQRQGKKIYSIDRKEVRRRGEVAMEQMRQAFPQIKFCSVQTAEDVFSLDEQNKKFEAVATLQFAMELPPELYNDN